MGMLSLLKNTMLEVKHTKQKALVIDVRLNIHNLAQSYSNDVQLFFIW